MAIEQLIRRSVWKSCSIAFCICAIMVHGQTSNTFPASGSVGIGTTSPSSDANLNIVGSGGGPHWAQVLIQPSSGQYWSAISLGNVSGGQTVYWVPTSGSGGGATSNFRLTALSSTGSLITEPFDVTTSGNVGIGTTIPAETLHVNGVQGTPAAGGNNTGLAWFSENNGNNGINLGYYYVPGQTPYGWMQSEYRGSPGVYYPMSLNPLGGNVGIGTALPGKPLDVSGTIRTSTFGNDTGGVIYPDGTQQTTAWTGVLCGGDYAEDMRASGDKAKYEPGDVLVLTSGDNNDVQKTAAPYSTLVAGIYATRPGVVGRRALVAHSSSNVPMAMVGVVPAKVSAENGPIRKGDLLVTSSTFGYAMKGTDRGRMLGAVIGKAMGSLDSGKGVIDVLVTLQ